MIRDLEPWQINRNFLIHKRNVRKKWKNEEKRKIKRKDETERWIWEKHKTYSIYLISLNLMIRCHRINWRRKQGIIANNIAFFKALCKICEKIEKKSISLTRGNRMYLSVNFTWFVHASTSAIIILDCDISIRLLYISPHFSTFHGVVYRMIKNVLTTSA